MARHHSEDARAGLSRKADGARRADRSAVGNLGGFGYTFDRSEMKIHSPKVSHQSIDGEVVIINLDNGSYYSLLDLGARLWELIAAGWSRAELLDLVAGTYPETEASERTAAFLDALVAEGLVSDTPGAEKRTVEVALPATFTAPNLETFTDLQELLMLDPIHEVDAAGWPHKPADS